jgi:hypothetical protein
MLLLGFHYSSFLGIDIAIVIAIAILLPDYPEPITSGSWGFGAG